MPRDLPNSETEHRSPALQANSLPSKPPGKPTVNLHSKAKAFNNYLLGTICTLEIPFEVPFALWKKSYVQPRQQIKKQRHYFANKGLSCQSYSFPAVMYGCESWTIKKAERQRIDAFELWCWRRLLRISWTARRSNQSILKEISPEYTLE